MNSNHIFNSDVISGKVLWIDEFQSTGSSIEVSKSVEINQNLNVEGNLTLNGENLSSQTFFTQKEMKRLLSQAGVIAPPPEWLLEEESISHIEGTLNIENDLASLLRPNNMTYRDIVLGEQLFYELTPNGSTSYTLTKDGVELSVNGSSENIPLSNLKEGSVYLFTNTSSGHPLEILNSNGAVVATQVNQVTTFKPTSIGNYTYRCKSHPNSMQGQISVEEGSSKYFKIEKSSRNATNNSSSLSEEFHPDVYSLSFINAPAGPNSAQESNPIFICKLTAIGLLGSAAVKTFTIDVKIDPNQDEDADGVLNKDDAFPFDPSESIDTDGDGKGDNADTDDDNDETLDVDDDFPLDSTEDTDTDGDNIGDNADLDDDNDGVSDDKDNFPLDPNKASGTDTDGDGQDDEFDGDDDDDGTPDFDDDFSLDPTEDTDTDGDGTGDNADTDDDGDGWSDAEEIVEGSDPLDDNSKPIDTDGDGIGNVADDDDDGDGVLDVNDDFPLDSQQAQTITWNNDTSHNLSDGSFSLGAFTDSGLALTYVISNTSIATSPVGHFGVGHEGNGLIGSIVYVQAEESVNGNPVYENSAGTALGISEGQFRIVYQEDMQLSANYPSAYGLVAGETYSGWKLEQLVNGTYSDFLANQDPYILASVDQSGADVVQKMETWLSALRVSSDGKSGSLNETDLFSNGGSGTHEIKAHRPDSFPSSDGRVTLSVPYNSTGAITLVTQASANVTLATVDASGSVTPLTGGVFTITISAPADPSYFEASLTTASITVIDDVTDTDGDGIPDLSDPHPNQQAQTITWNNTTSRNLSDGAFSLGASTDSVVTLTYTSSNTSIATVDANGLVTPLTDGAFTITISAPANASHFAASLTTTSITVIDDVTDTDGDGIPDSSDPHPNQQDQTITWNNTTSRNLSDGAFSLGASTDSVVTLTYTSSNTSIATVDANGLVTPLTDGAFTITISAPANASHFAASLTTTSITVIDDVTDTDGDGIPDSSDPHPNQQDQTITWNNTTSRNLSDGAFSLGASTDSVVTLTYTSSNTSIATVDANGLVTPLTDGAFTITISAPANASHFAASLTTDSITVTPSNFNLSIPVVEGATTSADSYTLPVGDTTDIRATIKTGYVFGGWSVTSGQGTFANASDPLTSFTGTAEGAVTISANVTVFEQTITEITPFNQSTWGLAIGETTNSSITKPGFSIQKTPTPNFVNGLVTNNNYGLFLEGSEDANNWVTVMSDLNFFDSLVFHSVDYHLDIPFREGVRWRNTEVGDKLYYRLRFQRSASHASYGPVFECINIFNPDLHPPEIFYYLRSTSVTNLNTFQYIVDVGSSLRVTLITNGIPEGTVVTYTIDNGVSDFGLSADGGNFTVGADGTAHIILTPIGPPTTPPRQIQNRSITLTSSTQSGNEWSGITQKITINN